jgi:hypothetical protein
MIKIILTLIAKVLENKLSKSGVEEKLLKYQSYITLGKGIWNKIDEDFRISDTVEKKIISKADEFDKALLAKFPELTQDDVAELRQSIAGEVNAGKEVVLSQVDALKQLQDSNNSLQADNANLKDQLSKIQVVVKDNINTPSNS